MSMTQEQQLDLYRTSVERLLTVVETHTNTSGGRAAAQVLLGIYNGYDFHMDLVDLVFLDAEDKRAAVHAIWLRAVTSTEPHTLVDNGPARFLALHNRFRNLHVEKRYAEHYQGGAAPAGPELYARIRPWRCS